MRQNKSVWMQRAAIVLFLALASTFALGMDKAKRVFPEGTKDANGVRTVELSEEDWRKLLTKKQFQVLREDDTEWAFTGDYWNTKEPGVYRCGGCGEPLFSSKTKFDSGSGWPSFTAPIRASVIREKADHSLRGMSRTEVRCQVCDGHLGHVFPDGPAPTGLRYCINSAALHFEPQADAASQKSPPSAAVTSPESPKGSQDSKGK